MSNSMSHNSQENTKYSLIRIDFILSIKSEFLWAKTHATPIVRLDVFTPVTQHQESAMETFYCSVR